jgi:hypothetical protein
MYEDEEEFTSTKINIPKYRIIHSDMEIEKREYLPTDNTLVLGDKNDKNDKSHRKEEKNLVERILECK